MAKQFRILYVLLTMVIWAVLAHGIMWFNFAQGLQGDYLHHFTTAGTLAGIVVFPISGVIFGILYLLIRTEGAEGKDYVQSVLYWVFILQVPVWPLIQPLAYPAGFGEWLMGFGSIAIGFIAALNRAINSKKSIVQGLAIVITVSYAALIGITFYGYVD